MTGLDLESTKFIICLKLLLIMSADTLLGSFDPWGEGTIMAPITKVVGFAIVGYSFIRMIERAEEDSKHRARA